MIPTFDWTALVPDLVKRKHPSYWIPCFVCVCVCFPDGANPPEEPEIDIEGGADCVTECSRENYRPTDHSREGNICFGMVISPCLILRECGEFLFAKSPFSITQPDLPSCHPPSSLYAAPSSLHLLHPPLLIPCLSLSPLCPFTMTR